MKYSVFPDPFAKSMVLVDQNWETFVDQLRSQTPRAKSSSQLIKLATFNGVPNTLGCLRYDSAVTAIYGIECDYDAEKMSPHEAHDRLQAAGIQSVVVTTHSHTPEAPRWRVFANLSRPHEPRERAELVGRINHVLGGVLAGESYTLSQSYFVGAPPGGEYLVLPVHGVCLDLLADMPSIGPVRAKPEPGQAAEAADLHHTVLDMTKAMVVSGCQETTMLEVMGSLTQYVAHHDAPRARDMPGEIFRAIRGAQEKYGQPSPVDPDTIPDPIDVDAGAETVKADVWVVRGLIEEGQHGLLAGPSGTYKSFICLQLAYCLNNGLPFFGHKVCKTGKVLYVNGEGTRNSIMRRWRGLLRKRGKGVGGFHVYPENVTITNPLEMERLKAFIEKHGYIMAIFDTFSSLAGRVGENDAGEIADALARVKRCCGDCLSMIVHHYGKNIENGIRGSSAFTGNVDFSLKVVRVNDVVTLSNEKERDGSPWKGTIIEAEVVPLGIFDEEGELTTLVVNEGIQPIRLSGAQMAARALYSACYEEGEPVTKPQWLVRFKADFESTNHPRDQQKAIEQGLVAEIKEGKSVKYAAK
jgi:hypothetical protein